MSNKDKIIEFLSGGNYDKHSKIKEMINDYINNKELYVDVTSKRNLAIFDMYIIDNYTQSNIAKNLQISNSRCSQLIRLIAVKIHFRYRELNLIEEDDTMAKLLVMCSTKTHNALFRSGFRSGIDIESLVHALETKSRKYKFSIKGIGEKGYTEIVNNLKELGIEVSDIHGLFNEPKDTKK